VSEYISPTVLVGEQDDWTAAAIAQVANDQGLEVVGRAYNAVEALSLSEQLHPGIVVLRHELPGTSGLDAARDLARAPQPPQIVLVSTDHGLATLAEAAGVYAVVPWRDIEALEQALAGAEQRHTDGDRRAGVDRRAGGERRQHQDWSKVFAERRDGGDRRSSPRRQDDG
jgi:DNA-binding NarL/FixJ family response regulator